ncbi:MAG: three-Cys-motif partner protein TcmP [Cenarchaeum sp. SB0663_bin_5]|nr:three-Cys-motif partner protein TcmP [Cenarchaeum sp. SB0663_bin_5]MYH04466.1 three-Cys-motif partner protein TcmP [Cenarchaeum sp. SB0675_bin_21]MYL11877.1 three-Cys-motif partner protein TcmP [Cenarchaeum sp. SB0669_bin_11]
MTQNASDDDPEFGGTWTQDKLDMLESYLNAYTTALKNKNFRLIYIDGFAGTGSVNVRYDDYVTEYINGSVMRALAVKDRQFDKLYCVEKDHNRYMLLKEKLKTQHRCEVIKADFNEYIESLGTLSNDTRGVVFIDPFGASVKWSTIKRIARLNALDMWLLYPTSAITRMLPVHKLPSEMAGWEDKLTAIFGGKEWTELYGDDPQRTITGEIRPLREEDAKTISKLYQSKLKRVFGSKLLNKTYEFKTRNNAVLFEFMFCVGSPSPTAIKLAKRIAGHILKKST